MSAEKQQDTGGNEPAVTGGADPSALAALAGALRTRLSFQQRLGLRAYPASPGLRRFLAGPQRPRQEPARGVVRPPVRAAAQPPALPADSGGLDSLGQWQRGTLVLKPYRPEPDAAACEVQVRVDADGRRAWVSETGCGAYRGAACVFEGQLQAR